MGYFKPLRRKIGVVTLVLAFLLMAVLIGSTFVIDKIAKDFGSHEKLVEFLQNEGIKSGMSSLITIWSVSLVWIILPLSLLSAWLNPFLPKERESWASPSSNRGGESLDC